jgi:hypothetical protein
MNAQSPESLNRDSFGTPLWESRDKEPFECGRGGVTQRILHGGRWWLPRVWAVVSQVSPGLLVACSNTESVPNVN